MALLAVIALGGAGFAWAKSAGVMGESDTPEVRGETVKRGPLSITVTESGNLASASSRTLTNELEGRTTILYLIEEGTHVEAGELLCELDTSNLVDDRVQQEIRVQNAEATYVKAKQNFEIQKSSNESAIALAERELEFAKEDRTKYEEGDWPQQEKQAEEAILLAKEELTRAKRDLEWSVKLADKGFLEQSQLEADRLSQTRADIQVKQALRDLELLREYEYPRRLKELEADVVEKGRELKRARLEADARIVDFEADMRTSLATLELEQAEFAQLLEQLGKAKIVAPVAGMVVYHKERSRWGNSEPIREGTEVRERQELIQIPSSDRMVAEVSLHESVLEKVEAGLPCRLRIDAIPGQSFGGVVKFKSVLPDQNSFWANPDLRVYRTDIEVTDRHPAMRPGMSCSVEILVEELEDALYVPVQSVFLDAGDPVVFVAGSGGEYERREVQVGSNDGKVVVVEDGVAEGEVVALSLPPGVNLRPASDERDAGGWEGGAPAGGGRPGAVPGGASGGRPAGTSGGPPSGRPSGASASRGGRESGRPTGGGERSAARGDKVSSAGAKAAGEGSVATDSVPAGDA